MADELTGKAYEKALLAWVIEQGTNATNGTERDYLQGFSGTKQDTIIEKSYGETLRGTSDSEKLASKNPFPRQPCTCTAQKDGTHGMDCVGHWLRTLNKHRTCYLYVHTITHEITGVRPERFVDGDEERQKREAMALGDLPDFPSCQPSEAMTVAREVYHKQKKLAILLAGCEDGMATAILQACQAGGVTVFDTRPWVLPVAKTKVKFSDHVETWTKQVKQGMKNGVPLLLDAAEEAPHFMDKLCTHAKYRNAFPEEVFNPAAKGWMKDLIFGKEPSADFHLALLTNLTPENYERELGGRMPLQFCSPVRVRKFVPARIIDVAQLKAEEKGGPFEAALAAGKTLLLLDNSEEKIVDTFLMYQRTTAVDLPQLLASDRSEEEMRDQLRAKMVEAMKAGNTLLLRLKGSTPDLLGSLCCFGGEFPREIFEGSAPWQQQAFLERFFKEEEKEHGVGVCRDGFQLVLTADVPLEEFAVRLGASVPLAKCTVYSVETRL